MRKISIAIFVLFLFYSCKESENQFIDYQQVNQDFEKISSIDLKEVKSDLDGESHDIYNIFLKTVADTTFTNHIENNLVESIDSAFSENTNLYDDFMKLISININLDVCKNESDSLCEKRKHFKDWLINSMVLPQFYCRDVAAIKKYEKIGENEFKYMVIYGYIMNRVYWKTTN